MTKTVISTFSLFLLTFFLLIINRAEATTSVKIENNGEGASSHVSVNSSTTSNFSNTTVVQSNSKSKVTITCDGKTYTYESDGNINENPCDGASVKINSNGTGAQVAPPNPTAVKEQVEKTKEEVKKKIEEEKAKIKATITSIPKNTSAPRPPFDIGSWLRSLFSALFK